MKHKTSGLLLTLILATPLPGTAANLIHRYSFNTDGAVEDTATGGTKGGTANLVNGALVGTATVSGGSLVTNAEPNGTAYASIPGAATAGITGSFSIQQFASPIFQSGFYQTLSIFTRPGGDNNGGTQFNILVSQPVRYENNFPSGFGYWQDGVNGNNQYLLTGNSGDSGSIEHTFTTTFDAITGTACYYYDAVLQSTSNAGALTGFNLSLLSNIGINGRSPFNDPSLGGTTNEFRIFDGALTADQVVMISTNADMLPADFEAAGIGVPTAAAIALKIVASTVNRSAGTFDVTFTSEAGKTYQVTQSTDLKTWTQAGSDIAGLTGQTSAHVTFSAAASRYFRVETK